MTANFNDLYTRLQGAVSNLSSTLDTLRIQEQRFNDRLLTEWNTGLVSPHEVVREITTRYAPPLLRFVKAWEAFQNRLFETDSSGAAGSGCYYVDIGQDLHQMLANARLVIMILPAEAGLYTLMLQGVIDNPLVREDDLLLLGPLPQSFTVALGETTTQVFVGDLVQRDDGAIVTPGRAKGSDGHWTTDDARWFMPNAPELPRCTVSNAYASRLHLSNGLKLWYTATPALKPLQVLKIAELGAGYVLTCDTGEYPLAGDRYLTVTPNSSSARWFWRLWLDSKRP